MGYNPVPQVPAPEKSGPEWLAEWCEINDTTVDEFLAGGHHVVGCGHTPEDHGDDCPGWRVLTADERLSS